MSLWTVRIACDAVTAPAVEFCLDAEGVGYASWSDVDGDGQILTAYLEAPDEAQALAARLRDAQTTWPAEARRGVAVEPLAREDWAESWKRFFHAEKVSERIVVRPSWESYVANADDCVVSIDPGMSFGTGLHFTTRSCLRFLDGVLRGGFAPAFCDLGCGSGILSIAAARLGVRAVTALDCDPDAVAATARNAELNGVGDRIEVTVCSLAEWRSPRRYPVVAANILGTVLRKHSDRIVASVAPGGVLLLAGTTRDDYAETVEAFLSRGFVETDRAQDATWRSGLLTFHAS